MIKNFYYLVISLLLIGPASAQVKTFSGNAISTTQIDRFIKKQMDSLQMPGLSIAIINNNRIVYDKAFGVANIDTKKPVDENSIFEAASLSKIAFTYLVLKMVDKGVLNLDTPLYRYMPYRDIERDERYKLITARIVLTHKTGFPNWRYADHPDSALHVKFPDLWLKFKPGAEFSYSGEGFYYLAQVVAYLNHRDLKTLDALYQQEVCEPLGLKHFYFTGNKYVFQHKVTGHENGKPEPWPWPSGIQGHDSTWFGAAEGLHTEATDYARFLIALMKHKGISKSSLDELLKAQVEFPEGGDYRAVGYAAWGLSVGIMHTPFGNIYLHAGNNGNFKSGFEYLKDRKTGFVFFTNCDKGDIFNKNLSNFLLKPKSGADH